MTQPQDGDGSGEDQAPPDAPDLWLPPAAPGQPEPDGPSGRRAPQESEQKPRRRERDRYSAVSESGGRVWAGAAWARVTKVVARIPARLRTGVGIVLVLGVLYTAGHLVLLRGDNHEGSSPRIGAKPRPTAPPVPEHPVTVSWRVTPDELRPDLPEPEFVGYLDGDFAGPWVIAVDPAIADVWVVATGDEHERDMVVHGIDPATGAPLWQRPMDGALCAREVTRAGLACAEALDRDPATGLGRQWALHLLDPLTGKTRRSVEVDGWLSALHRSGETLVVLEQREPAPHAVVRGFDVATLKPRWVVDLKGQRQHDEMFTDNRIITRTPPDREGPVLDRPRLRDVGFAKDTDHVGNGGLVAVWAGQATAFIDPRAGRLVMMPHCSRLVDDGRRLWCNEVDGATAYSYRGRPLVRVTGPRLAFPDDDGVGVDRNRPVFLDDEGAPVAVDRTNGTVGDRYGKPGSGSVFGMKTMPSAQTVGDMTLLVGEGGTMLLDPDEDAIVWQNKYIRSTDQPMILDEVLVVGSYEYDVLDPRTGERTSTVRLEGLYVSHLGDRVAGAGMDELLAQRLG